MTALKQGIVIKIVIKRKQIQFPTIFAQPSLYRSHSAKKIHLRMLPPGKSTIRLSDLQP